MNRLYRSRSNRVLFGVCGGLGEYFRIDATIIRIICILISLSGTGILIYLIASIIMPDESRGSATKREQEWTAGSNASGTSDKYTAGDDNYSSTFSSDLGNNADEWKEPTKYNSEKNKLIFGAILVGLGILILGNQVLPALFKLDYFVPLLLIGIGGFIVYRGRRY